MQIAVSGDVGMRENRCRNDGIVGGDDLARLVRDRDDGVGGQPAGAHHVVQPPSIDGDAQGAHEAAPRIAHGKQSLDQRPMRPGADRVAIDDERALRRDIFPDRPLAGVDADAGGIRRADDAAGRIFSRNVLEERHSAERVGKLLIAPRCDVPNVRQVRERANDLPCRRKHILFRRGCFARRCRQGFAHVFYVVPCAVDALQHAGDGDREKRQSDVKQKTSRSDQPLVGGGAFGSSLCRVWPVRGGEAIQLRHDLICGVSFRRLG